LEGLGTEGNFKRGLEDADLIRRAQEGFYKQERGALKKFLELMSKYKFFNGTIYHRIG